MVGRNRKKIVAILVFCLGSLLLIGTVPQNASLDSYSQIRNSIRQISNSKVLEISPDLNPRYFPWLNQIATSKQSFDPAQSDPAFMQAASISQIELVKYLSVHGYTHVLLAPVDGKRNRIFYRWANNPSVDIELEMPYFREVARAFGDFPATLFEVAALDSQDPCTNCNGVKIVWRNIRENAIDTDRFGYVDGPDFVWILGQDRPSLKLVSEVTSNSKYLITFGLIAAYGGQAPPQLLRFTTENSMLTKQLTAGPATYFSIELRVNEELRIDPALPCVIPAFSKLGEDSGDLRELCYGITSLKIVEIN